MPWKREPLRLARENSFWNENQRVLWSHSGSTRGLRRIHGDTGGNRGTGREITRKGKERAASAKDPEKRVQHPWGCQGRKKIPAGVAEGKPLGLCWLLRVKQMVFQTVLMWNLLPREWRASSAGAGKPAEARVDKAVWAEDFRAEF